MKAICFVAFVVFCVLSAAVVAEEHPKVGGFVVDFFGNVTDRYSENEINSAKNFIEMNHAIKRYAYVDGKVQEISSDFCAPKRHYSNGTYSIDDCQWPEYVSSLFLGSSVTISLAFFIFPFLFCGICWFRCCCCGKYTATNELCCGSHDDFNARTDGYTDCAVNIFFVLAVVCALIIGVGAALSSSGSSVMSGNVGDVINFTNFTLKTLSNIIESVVVEFEKTNQSYPNLSIDMDTILALANTSKILDNYTEFIHLSVDTAEIAREIIMSICLFIPFIFMVLVAISRWCCWGLSWGMATCGFIFTFTSLASFSFLYPLSLAASDMCILVNESVSDPDADPFVTSLFSCENGSAIAQLTDVVYDVVFSAAGYGCDFFDELRDMELPCEANNDGIIILNNTNYTCPVMKVPSHADDCDYDDFRQLVNGTKMYDWKIGCFCPESEDTYKKSSQVACGTVHDLTDTSTCSAIGTGCIPMYCYSKKEEIEVDMYDCSISCSDETLAQMSSTIYGYSGVITEMLHIFNTTIKPYINCESFSEILMYAKDFVCVGMMNSFSLSYVGEIICAIGCFLGTFVALLGMKRFNKENRMMDGPGGYSSIGEKQELNTVLV